jgi:hypothetical protein
VDWQRDRSGALVPSPEREPAPSLIDHEEIEWLMARGREGWKKRLSEMSGPMMADSIYYRDTISKRITADFGQITLSTTSLMILNPVINWSTIAGYWDLGKRWKITVFGKATTGTTPGNLTVEIRYGTTDAGGTILQTSAATALGASKTSISWRMEAYIHARAALGTAAGLFAWGVVTSDIAGGLLTNALQPLFIPASLAAAVNVDTTAAGGVNIQWKRSGSTGELVTVQDLIVEALT